MGVAVLFLTGFVALLAHGAAGAQSCKKVCTASAAFSTNKKHECKTPCAEASKAACSATCKTPCQSSESCCPGGMCDACRKKTAEAIKKVATDLPYRESKRLVLTGEYVCGKCGLEKMDSCQGFFKTAQGDLYPLLKGTETKMMGKMAHKQEKNKFEIVGKVRIVDGVKYIEVTSVAGM
ncbi:MAG: hypothetical protein HY770_00200 [Chitinivibrionia bacterium]|nr:hypothetical protein [Chitinivibrionia bacterium]